MVIMLPSPVVFVPSRPSITTAEASGSRVTGRGAPCEDEVPLSAVTARRNIVVTIQVYHQRLVQYDIWHLARRHRSMRLTPWSTIERTLFFTALRIEPFQQTMHVKDVRALTPH